MAEVHALPGATVPPAPQPPKRKRRPSQAWRWQYVHEAGCEIEAIAQALLREVPEPDDMLVRALAKRLEALSGAIMSADTDDQRDVGSILFGREVVDVMIERERSRRGRE